MRVARHAIGIENRSPGNISFVQRLFPFAPVAGGQLVGDFPDRGFSVGHALGSGHVGVLIKAQKITQSAPEVILMTDGEGQGLSVAAGVDPICRFNARDEFPVVEVWQQYCRQRYKAVQHGHVSLNRTGPPPALCRQSSQAAMAP